MTDTVLDRQRARVALRLMTPRDRHLLRVLSDLSNMSTEEAAEEMVTRYDGDIDVYRIAVIERELKRTPRHGGGSGALSRKLVLDILTEGQVP